MRPVHKVESGAAISDTGRNIWTISDVWHLVATFGFVAGALVVCWIAVSTTVRWSTQTAWLAGAAGFLLLAAAAATRWLIVGFAAVRQRHRAVDERSRSLAALIGDRLPGAPAKEAAVDGSLVSGAGMRHYHLSLCPLVVGKAVVTLPRGDHATAGRTPCGVCGP